MMDMLGELKALGVNIDEGLERLSGNIPFYEKMLFKFKDMMDKSNINLDFGTDDYTSVIEEVHAIKGTSGNLSVTPIFEAYNEALMLLRSDKPEQAKEVLKNILPVQKDILDCIERYK